MLNIKKLSQKTVLLVTLLLLITMCNIALAEDWGTDQLKISTGPTGGTFEVVGAAAAEILKNEISGLNINSVPGPGSAGNPTVVNRKTAMMGMPTGSSAVDAWLGKQPYESEHRDLRAVMALYPNTYQMWVLKDSDIYQIDDLVGKRFAPGSGPGSGPYPVNINMLKVHGISFDDIENAGGDVLLYSWSEATSALTNKNIDAVAWTTSFPQSTIVDVTMKRDLRMISIREEKRKEFLETFPGFIPLTIPANTYKGQNEPVETIASPVCFVVHKDLSDKLVNAITKALWENKNKLSNAHSLLKDMGADNVGKGMGIPLHPGAIEAYQELGIDYDESLVPMN